MNAAPGEAQAAPPPCVTGHGVNIIHLSQSLQMEIGEVTAMLQDSRGFLWLGTEKGLVRFDGEGVVLHNTRRGGEGALHDDRIYAILEDARGDLWFGTGAGIEHYDRVADMFEIVFPEGAPEVRERVTALAWKDGERTGLLFGTAGGWTGDLRVTCPRSSLRTFSTADASVGTIRRIRAAADGGIWMASDHGGVLRYEPRQGVLSPVYPASGDPGCLPRAIVRDIAFDRLGRVWIATDAGLHRAAAPGAACESVPLCPGTTPADVVSCLLVDSQGRLWVGTDGGGLSVCVPGEDRWTHHVHDRQDSQSISSNVIRQLYEDPAGNLWIAHYPKGLDHISPAYAGIRTVRWKAGAVNWLSNDSVTCLAEDADGSIWLGTDGGGLNRFDRARNRFEVFMPDPAGPGSISAPAVLSVLVDSHGVLWAGTWNGGLNRRDPATGRFEHFLPDPSNPRSLPSANVWALLEDRKGNLWVGTMGGLCLFNPETRDFTVYRADAGNPRSLLNNEVWVLHEDGRGVIWAGTTLGMCRMDGGDGGFTHFVPGRTPGNPGAETWITAIHEDAAGRFWVGTFHRGLFLFDTATGSFTPWKRSELLPDPTICAILDDPKGMLWLSTCAGLVHIDPATGSTAVYDESVGLQGRMFNRFAALKARSGEFFFGGVDGFSYFLPGGFDVPLAAPAVHITGLEIFNQPVCPGPESAIQVNIMEAGEVRLRHDQSVVSFHFSVVDTANPGRHHIRFRLDGFDSDWRVAGADRMATYTNLDPGRYRLEVEVDMPAGSKGAGRAAVDVIVIPPFWSTWWFRGLALFAFTLLVAAAGWLVSKARFSRRLREVEAERALILEREKANARMRQKQRMEALGALAGGIAHDFNNILTAIFGNIGLLQLSLKDRPDVAQDLDQLNKAALRARDLVRQILMFSRRDTGAFEPFQAGDVVEEVRSLLRSTKPSGVALDVNVQRPLPDMNGSASQFHQVVMNLVTNAIHALPGEKGNVGIVLDQVEIKDPNVAGMPDLQPGLHIRLRVTDNGCGMEAAVIERIFDPFFTTKPKGKGTGLGLSVALGIVQAHKGAIRVDSSPGHGTTFTVCFPAIPGSGPRERVEAVTELPKGRGEGILFVDDDQAQGSAAGGILKQLNYRPRVHSSATEALEEFKKETSAWHVLITDYGMPGLNGAELAEAARWHRPELITVLMSGATDRMDEDRAMELGFTAWLPKPYSPADLAALLKRLLHEETPEQGEPGKSS